MKQTDENPLMIGDIEYSKKGDNLNTLIEKLENNYYMMSTIARRNSNYDEEIICKMKDVFKKNINKLRKILRKAEQESGTVYGIDELRKDVKSI